MNSEIKIDDWRAALIQIAHTLNTNNIDYKVVGGTVAALYGISTPIKDIDIELSAEDSYRFQELFADYIVEPVSLSDNGEHRSHYGKFMIKGIPVDIMGDPHRRSENLWVPAYTLTLAILKLNAIDIMAPWLEEETLAYIRRGKMERAGLCLPHCNQTRLLALLQGKQLTNVI
ncbi:MAG: hypothetical protein ABFS03_00095 [Chloroflexota bacterium]